MADKKTKREVLGIIKAAMADNAEVVAYVDNEIALLDKKNAYRKAHPTLTKDQKAALELRPVVLGALTSEGQTASAIAKAIGVENFQKVSPILKSLVADGLATRVEGKAGKVFYTLPAADTDAE